MIQLPVGITGNDVNQWLDHGVCMLDRIRPAFYLGLGPDVIRLRDVRSDLREDLPFADATRLWCHWPRCGALNLPGTAVYLMRRQQQQYRRTYHSRALSVVLPDKWEILTHNPSLVQQYSDPMNTPVVLEAFNPVYPDWDAAMTMLEAQPFVAINSHIILGGTPNKLSVYHKGKKCGMVLEPKIVPVGKGLPVTRAYKLLQGRISVC
jgi:hypothetical protein